MDLDFWDYIGLAITLPLILMLWLGAVFAFLVIGRAFLAAWREKL